MTRFAGRTALVTGAAGGIGAAIVPKLGRPGRGWRSPTATRPVSTPSRGCRVT